MTTKSERWMRGTDCIVKLHGPARIGWALFLAALVFIGCDKKEDVLAPSIAVSGKVTNNSGQAGTIFVEIDHNLRDIADAGGLYSIGIHKDFYIDSLYAWVDKDGNSAYTAGEPFGFYHSSADPLRAKAMQARSTNIGNINFSIP
ncbi:MAG: hypothetical protein NTW97_05610 [Candidatus Krumholzibacteria bacterium]|nr:hypothetical protein [Candidatus Krumholzibacteria bacterium]